MHGFTLYRNVILFITGILLWLRKYFYSLHLSCPISLTDEDLKPKAIILISLTVITVIGKFKINWMWFEKEWISPFPKFWIYVTLLGSDTSHLIYVTKFGGNFVTVYGKLQRQMINWPCFVKYLSTVRQELDHSEYQVPLFASFGCF